MKRTAVYGLLFLIGATVPACTEPIEPCPDSSISFNASIAQSDPTRTTMTGSKASFTANDQIGVFETLTSRSNVLYTYNGTSWSTTTPMYWRNNTSTHTFYAYYPYNATNQGTKVSVPVLSTQSIGSTPSTSTDLLVTPALNQTRSAGINLTFTHAFALIQLNIKIGVAIVNPYYLNRITIRGGNPTGSTQPYGIANISGNPSVVGYDLVAGSIWAATNNTTCYTQSFYSDISPTSLTTTAITLYAFVLPGTFANPLPAISFRISILGVNNSTSFSSLSQTNIQAGTKYVYDVSIGALTRTSEPSVTITPKEIVPYGTTTIKQP